MNGKLLEMTTVQKTSIPKAYSSILMFLERVSDIKMFNSSYLKIS